MESFRVVQITFFIIFIQLIYFLIKFIHSDHTTYNQTHHKELFYTAWKKNVIQNLDV